MVKVPTEHELLEMAPSVERIEIVTGGDPWKHRVLLFGSEIDPIDVALIEQALWFRRPAGTLWHVQRA